MYLTEAMEANQSFCIPFSVYHHKAMKARHQILTDLNINVCRVTKREEDVGGFGVTAPQKRRLIHVTSGMFCNLKVSNQALMHVPHRGNGGQPVILYPI